MTEYFNCATKLQEKTIKEKGFDFWLENRDVYDKPCKDLFGEYVYTMNDLEIFIK